METFPATVARLVGALETLSSAETVLLSDEAWSELALIQQRASIIVDKLVELMSRPGAFAELDAPLFARVRALTEAQEQKISLLSQLKANCAEELRALGKSRQNVRSLAPAYRGPTVEDGSSLSFAAKG